jgi:hypothetical protein
MTEYDVDQEENTDDLEVKANAGDAVPRTTRRN